MKTNRIVYLPESYAEGLAFAAEDTKAILDILTRAQRVSEARSGRDKTFVSKPIDVQLLLPESIRPEFPGACDCGSDLAQPALETKEGV